MTFTDWILAICAVISIPISIWAITISRKAISIVNKNTTAINNMPQNTGNVFTNVTANSNGVAGIMNKIQK